MIVFIYSFIAFLSFNLLKIAKSMSDREPNVFIIPSTGLIFWYLISGRIIPLIVMCIFVKWYWIVPTAIILILGSKLVASFFNRTLSFFTALITNIVSIIILSIICYASIYGLKNN